MRPGDVDGRRSMAAQVPRVVTAALPVVPERAREWDRRAPYTKSQ